MSKETRRDFLAATGKLLVGTAAFATVGAQASDEDEHEHKHGNSNGLLIEAAAEETCGTCRFWGGMRRISDDGEQVIAQSMGWCNNPKSRMYRKLTTADHLMKKAGNWQKWTAL